MRQNSFRSSILPLDDGACQIDHPKWAKGHRRYLLKKLGQLTSLFLDQTPHLQLLIEWKIISTIQPALRYFFTADTSVCEASNVTPVSVSNKEMRVYAVNCPSQMPLWLPEEPLRDGERNSTGEEDCHYSPWTAVSEEHQLRWQRFSCLSVIQIGL